MQEPRAVLEERSEISTSAPHGWHKENLGAFTVFLPPKMKYIKQEGIDSFVGEFQGKSLTLRFDYGGYSQTTASYNESGGRGIIRRFLIDARQVDFVYPDSGFMAFFQPEYAGAFSLSMHATTESRKDIETAELIMRTLRFVKTKTK